ncbi:7-cyano-7-deazaguanine synthase [Marinobacter sp. AN1]|nr:7-cyano-7-deazaguanine synthase [Marinobacter sp. AN1]
MLELARSGTIIQPHYILDSNRSSLSKELEVMNDIRQKVNARFKNSHIEEIKTIDQSDISIYEEFSQAHKSLLAKDWIGSQYVGIASYAKANNINKLELSINYGDSYQRTNFPDFQNTYIDNDGFRIIANDADRDLQTLFGQFSFPVMSLTKLDMLKKSKEWEVHDLMNKTWFCHQPFLGQPCGSCNPCIHTLEAGLRYRFSTISLFRYRIKKLIISYPKLHRTLSKLKYGEKYF